ncbi:MAG: FeoB-associated Cys-rich membrane protein [Lawsonibacter sp.]|nr:FeoB-associated Cys-rich membrane protein [Lawsonibacter sp.]
MNVGEIAVILLLVCIVGLAVRFLWKNHRSSGACKGDCGQCSGCCHK